MSLENEHDWLLHEGLGDYDDDNDFEEDEDDEDVDYGDPTWPDWDSTYWDED